MTVFLSQIMNGIQNGVIYASLGLAIVLIFRTTGILNFAQGEMALFSTYITWELTRLGLPVWLAIIVSMTIAFIGGALIERIVIRPFESSSPLVLVIVTIGLFLTFNALAQLLFGVEAKALPRAYPDRNWLIGGVSLRSDTLVLIGVLAVECLLLWALLQRTKIGLALRSVASNAESARLLGVSAATMLMLGWGLAAALGCLAGALFVPTTSGLTAGSMQGILVFAFAGVALGGFDSPIGAVVGGLIIGIVDALTRQYIPALTGIEIIVPFGLILVVLLIRPQGLFGHVKVERV
ncbi:MAG: branched-chain amino acid ABC transporter permease [Actinomycetes bacterium]